MKNSCSMRASLCAVIATVSVLILTGTSFAVTITMDGTDTIGTTSFNTGLNWSNDLAPAAGTNYLVDAGNTLLYTKYVVPSTVILLH